MVGIFSSLQRLLVLRNVLLCGSGASQIIGQYYQFIRLGFAVISSYHRSFGPCIPLACTCCKFFITKIDYLHYQLILV